MLKMRSVVSAIMFVIVAVSLSSCASSTVDQLMKGKQDFINQRYDLSYIHVNQAAHAGDPDAQYALGYMYYYGKGVPQDYKLANYWIAKSAAQGQPLARKAQEMMHKSGRVDQSSTKPTTIYGSSQPLVKQRVDGKAVVPQKMAKPKITKQVKYGRKYSRSERGLLVAPRHHYTIQLMGSRSSRDAMNFVHRHHLSHAKIYHTYHNGHGWFVVVDGNFKSMHVAERALHRLTKSLRVCKPWVKSIAVVQREIRAVR